LDLNVRRKLLLLLGLIAGLLLTGAVGFRFLENWSWLDSAYAALITLATVGYGDFVPHSPAGKVFAMGLVVFGLGTISYALLELTAFVVDGHLNQLLRLRKVDNMIKRVAEHYIVCGAGRTGKHIVAELAKNKVPFVVIDREAARLADREIQSHPHIIGDATDDAVLERAGIKKAKALAAALETDEANVFLLLTAKNLNADLRIVTKAVNDAATPKLLRAGASAVVAPNFIGGLRLASEMLRPNVVSFLDTMLRHSDDYRFEEATLTPSSTAAGKTLREIDLFGRFAINPVAIRDGGETFHYNPSPDHRLKAGDTLVVIAEPDKLGQLRRYLSG
jgi:voltage-gated potassium channel